MPNPVFAVHYIDMRAADALPVSPDTILGAVGYGAERPDFLPAECPFIATPLAPADGTAMVEIWSADAPCRPVQVGQVIGACNGDLAFGAILLDEGGAGSLEVAPGKQLVDSEGFPEAYKAVALAHRDAFDYLKTVGDLDWTFFAPAALIAPGERTGTFRTGVGKLIVDAQGNSKISAEDYAIAFVDALEQDSFVREIATVAY